MTPLTGSQVIRLFGGLGPLHEITGCSRANCEQWKRQGVAPRYWDDLIAAARRLRISGVTEEALKEGYCRDRDEVNRRDAERKAKRARAAARAAARQRRLAQTASAAAPV